MGEGAPGLAVISGGGSGIGREIALALARRGHPIAVLGRRQAPLEATLAQAGDQGMALSCDVRKPDQVESAARRIHQQWPSCEILVPAAGIGTIAPLTETSALEFSDVVDTNLVGVFHLLRVFLPPMQRQGRGWIFPLISVAGRQSFSEWSAYCASKWGLGGLIAALRQELQGSGVRVTSLYPGATASPFWDGLPGDWDRTAMLDPSEVARVLVGALEVGPTALVEEIHLGPAGGSL